MIHFGEFRDFEEPSVHIVLTIFVTICCSLIEEESEQDDINNILRQWRQNGCTGPNGPGELCGVILSF